MVLLINLVHSAHSAVLVEAKTKFFDNLQILFLQFKTKDFSLVFSFMRLNHWLKGPKGVYEMAYKKGLKRV